MMYKENFIAVVKCNGKILREKNGVVYLPFGSEYSILLKNQDTRKAVVAIEVDGVNVLNSNKLIVEGNTNQEVKGFMRSMKETNNFKFINKTKEIQSYRGDKIEDGFIRISYQFEAVQAEPLVIYQENIPTWAPYKYYMGNYDTNLCSVSSDLSTTRDINYCSSNISNAPLPNEGITVKGSKVNVQYSYGNTNILENTTHIIVLQLKGVSAKSECINKPLTVNTRVLCSTCGRKNRSNNNFCYSCGTFLN